ncbi:MAG: alpha-L-fucosidase [Flavobacteriaceae bacterium]|nr:alpha-L-fucosidase [Flavobacteriaceae bacterium]NVJ71896.1 alpha-L-fucosidase [Flavobacteriaceae bacterium]
MKTKIILLSIFLLSLTARSQEQYTPTKAILESREQFQNDKFGMFIHWGLSSMFGDGEWVMQVQGISKKDYQAYLPAFHPSQFNAEEWVLAAKGAGMNYIIFITRHHDGFSNWDTAYSDWKITNTPYGKDVLKQLAEACKKHDMKLGLYYSTLDWVREDYPWRSGRTGQKTGRTGQGDYASYLQFMKNQLTELLTNYGDIYAIWFDGHWDQTNPEGHEDRSSRIDWKYDEIYGLIHKLQPSTLVGNNHHLDPIAGEDFQMFERDLPGENHSGFNFQKVTDKLPLESCETMNGSWGYNISDHKFKSKRELLHLLIGAAGRNSNLLLNVGPKPSGVIPQESLDGLKQMGEWTSINGASIYGTRGGPLSPQVWGVSTQNDTHVFVHILNHPKDQSIFIPGSYAKKAVLLDSGKKLKIRWESKGIHVMSESIPYDEDPQVLVLDKN